MIGSIVTLLEEKPFPETLMGGRVISCSPEYFIVKFQGFQNISNVRLGSTRQ